MATELDNGVANFTRSRDSNPILDKLWDISDGISPFIQIKSSCNVPWRHCKNKREQIWRISLEDFARAPRNHDGIFTSGVSTANQITSLVCQNLADQTEFLRDFWSGPILASDDIREHMSEAKNGPDRRLLQMEPRSSKRCLGRFLMHVCGEILVRNSPRKAVKMKSNVFDIFGLSRQIPHRV